jgi:hypothetical protein
VPLLERALGVCERAHTGAGEDERVCGILGKLASALEDRGDYTRALKLYAQQLRGEEARLGPGSVQVAATLCNLANAHIGTGRYAEVLPFFQRALGIVETAVGPGHVACAAILVSTANFRREEGEYSAARELLARARALQERHLGKDAAETAETVEALAALSESAGDHRAASDSLETALVARRAIATAAAAATIAATTAATTAATAATETMANGRCGGRDSAVAVAAAAAAAAEAEAAAAAGAAAAEKLLAVGAALARTYHAQARYEDALPLLREAAAAARPEAGHVERRALARALAAAGDSRREAGAAAEAAALYAQALPLLEALEENINNGGDVSGKHSAVLLEVSRVAMHLAGAIASSARVGGDGGAAQQAVAAAERAATAHVAAVGDPTHPDLAATLYRLAALRDAAGDGDGAAAAYERAFAILDLQEHQGSEASRRTAAAAADRQAAVAARQREKLEAYRDRLASATSAEADRDRLRAAVRADLAQREAGCATLADLLRALGVTVEGGGAPTAQQLASAYKRALLRYHPDRAATRAADERERVHAEEVFKLVTQRFEHEARR